MATARRTKAPGPKKPRRRGLDGLIISQLFFRGYREGATEVAFVRDDYDHALDEVKKAQPQLFRAAAQASAIADDLEIEAAGGDSAIPKHKNIGAVIYDFRFRRRMPPEIRAKEYPDQNKYWRIKLAGKGKYKFILGPNPIITPSDKVPEIEIFEATPEIITHFSFLDEQALLAKVRYNRLIDTFLGITAHSLQSHLRTSVDGIGQIEIDELYVGQDGAGKRYVVPVQAKGRTDKLSIVQTEQDLEFCRETPRFRDSIPRCVSAQFLPDGRVHLFELVETRGNIRVLRETRYRFIGATPDEAIVATGRLMSGGGGTD